MTALLQATCVTLCGFIPKTPVDILVVCETEYPLLLLLSRESQLLFRNCCHKVRFVTWNTKYSTYN